jgi:flagellar basal-body rod protein FlgC
MYGALDISTSGLIAQRTRLEAITVNIANQASKDTGNGSPFARRIVHFASGDPSASTRAGRTMGVHVAEIQKDRSFTLRYEPDDRAADSDGYVKYPDINPTMEMMNGYDAQRAYEANLTAAEATKTIMAQALRLLA